MAEHQRLAAPARAAGRAPVETAKTRSPSNGVCAGWIARARPPCATSASRRAPALSSATSVATMASVVLAAGSSGPGFIGRGVNGATRAAAGPSPPNSSPISKAPAQNARLPGTHDAAEGVDRDQRPDRRPAPR